jgi:hypothetical protein
MRAFLQHVQEIQYAVVTPGSYRHGTGDRDVREALEVIEFVLAYIMSGRPAANRHHCRDSDLAVIPR